MEKLGIVNKGMLYALGDASLYSLTKLAVKSVSSVTKMQISAFRAGLQFLILLPYCLKSQSSENLLPLSIDWSIQFKLAIRGIFGIAASVFHYYAIEVLPLGDVSSLMFCQGFFTSILSWVFLGEALNLYDGALLFVTILGCACIAQPKLLIDYALGNIEDVSRVADLLTGLKLASIALVIQGIASTSIRGIKKDVHHSIVTFYYTLFGALVLWPLLFSLEKVTFPSFKDLGFLFFISISGFTCQSLMTKALQHCSAFEASIYLSSELVFGYVMDAVFYDRIPTWWSVGGACLILGSALLVAWKNHNKKTE